MSRRVRFQLVLPALIAASLITLWVVSCYACVRVTRGGGRRDPCVLLACGKIIYWPSGGGQAEPPFAGRTLQRGEWAVQLARVPDPPELWMRGPVYYVPLWMLSLPTIVGPLCYLDHRQAVRKALRKGLCPACGYDLRATRDGRGLLVERCPECGTDTQRFDSPAE